LRTVEVNDVNMMSAHQRFGIANKDVPPVRAPVASVLIPEAADG